MLYVVLLLCVVLLGVLVVCRYKRENFSSVDVKGGGTCQEKTCGSSSSALLPLMEPEFNLRECAKQLILLEDHLSNPEKRCRDCIAKHCLTIEALAEEGASLDKKGDCRGVCVDLAQKMREIEKEFLSGKDGSEIAQELREIRKPLVQKYFDKV